MAPASVESCPKWELAGSGYTLSSLVFLILGIRSGWLHREDAIFVHPLSAFPGQLNDTIRHPCSLPEDIIGVGEFEILPGMVFSHYHTKPPFYYSFFQQMLKRPKS